MQIATILLLLGLLIAGSLELIKSMTSEQSFMKKIASQGQIDDERTYNTARNSALLIALLSLLFIIFKKYKNSQTTKYYYF
jgi:hypothetical protein